MKGSFLLWVRGTVRIRVLGENCERFLNLCAHHGIPLWELRPVKGGCDASLAASHFRSLKPLVHKCRLHIQILQKQGIPFFLFRYRKRRILFLSLAAALCMTGALSFFIWDIQIEGNLSVTDEKILDYLHSEEVHQGRLKTSVDYKQLASNLRQNFPEIAWVSVKLQGTRLCIDLKEQNFPEEETKETAPGSLISDVDGTVVSIITRAGTALVGAGSEIKRGDLLVDGTLELVNDSGEVYAYQYTAADADIYVKTSFEYRDSFSLKQKKKLYTGQKKNRKLLQIGTVRIGLPFGSIPYEQYDMITEQKQLRLMENFYLPVYYSSITINQYRTVWQLCTPEEGEKQLQLAFENFLEKIEQKGVQIFQNDVKIESTDSVSTAEGTIWLIQKAGQRTALETENQKEGTLTE